MSAPRHALDVISDTVPHGIDPKVRVAAMAFGRMLLACEESRCITCGHAVCPFCGDWCDTLVRGDELCCSGECTFE